MAVLQFTVWPPTELANQEGIQFSFSDFQSDIYWSSMSLFSCLLFAFCRLSRSNNCCPSLLSSSNDNMSQSPREDWFVCCSDLHNVAAAAAAAAAINKMIKAVKAFFCMKRMLITAPVVSHWPCRHFISSAQHLVLKQAVKQHSWVFFPKKNLILKADVITL